MKVKMLEVLFLQMTRANQQANFEILQGELQN